jgi:2-methylisocitrate lyase-like PEP mutase family enzyme
MDDTAAQTRYEQFAELHRGPATFIMPNAWDGPSALLFKEAGFRSIATSSAVLAATLGRLDGIHAVSRDEHLGHAALLTSVSGLPINGDFEDGYGTKTSVPPSTRPLLTVWPGLASRTPPVTPPRRFVNSMTRSVASRRLPRLRAGRSS